MSTSDDGAAEKDPIERLRDCRDTLELVANGDYPATDICQRLLEGLEEVED